MRKPVLMIKASLYRIHQLMNIKLGLKNRMNYYTIFRVSLVKSTDERPGFLNLGIRLHI